MRNSIVYKIIGLFVLFGVIPMLLFDYIFILDNQKASRLAIQESLEKLVEEKSQVLNLTFKQVEIEVENLGEWIEHYMSMSITDKEYEEFMKKYKVDNNDTLFRKNYFESLESKKKSNDISNVFFPSNKILNREIIKEIIKTEKVEQQLKRINEKIPDAGWIYIITSNNLLRIYPYTSIETFEPGHTFENDIYYKIASERHNPSKKIIWTMPYNDWCGRGWTVTCSYPIYIDGQFKGVVSIDIPLDSISKTVADFHISKSGFAFLIDEIGNVIYHPKLISDSKSKGEIFSTNLLMHSKDNNYRSILYKMINGENGFGKFTDEDKGIQKAIAFTNIDNVNWSIGIEVDWKTYIENNLEDPKNVFFLILPIIVIITIAGIYLFKVISNPIIALSNDVENISKGCFGDVIKINSKDEIGVLADSFNKMSISIKNYTDDLLKKNKEIEAIFNSFPGVLYIIDLNYNIKLANSEGEKFLVKHEKQDIDKKCYEVFYNSNTPCLGCPKDKTLKLKKEYCADIVIENKLYQICSYPIFNEKNEINEVVLYNTDITEKFMLEKKIAQAEKLAGIGQIAASVTHELKNPISVIKGAHYLLNNMVNEELEESDLKKEFSYLLEQIDDSLEHSEKTIYNLLDFSRKTIRNIENVNIVKTIEQILILEKNYFIKHNIKIHTEYDAQEIYAYANLDSLKHIFLNLISNAIQAMLGREGVLKIFVKILVQDGVEKVKVVIKDNGCGILESIQSKIFEPFVTTKTENGYGLGLWIVKNEINKLNGEIILESKEGLGTSFTVILPARRI